VPLHPAASLGGLWILIGVVALISWGMGSFLGRPAMGLTASAEAIVCAALLAVLRAIGYRLAIVPRGTAAT
jgi:hypothetical protein